MYNLRPLSHYFKYLIATIDLWILKRRGLQIGKQVFIGQDVKIDPVFPCLVSIGDKCRITANTVILTHDSSGSPHSREMMVGKVSIGRNTTIGCGSIILPGVTIGENAIIGSGSVVTKDIPSNSVAFGNPCKVIDTVENVIRKQQGKYKRLPIYFADAQKD